MRLAKYIAAAGICSRREAEKLIFANKITVNNQPVKTPAIMVGDEDVVAYNGAIITPQNTNMRLFCFHKPKGCITTERDEKGRMSVFDILEKHRRKDTNLPRLITVGRLDYNSEGLLLLTNNGELSRQLELPNRGWIRRYKVRVYGKIAQSKLDILQKGICIDGINYAKVEANIDRTQGHNTWVNMALREGKNREIRRIMEHFDCVVNRLIRVSYGPFQLGNLQAGEVREVGEKTLHEQLGKLVK